MTAKELRELLTLPDVPNEAIVTFQLGNTTLEFLSIRVQIDLSPDTPTCTINFQLGAEK